MLEQWVLHHGCHRGTLTSRDSGGAEYFDTRQQAVEAYQKHRKFYRSIGYQIWFATVTSPDGVKETLEQNPYW